MKAATCTWLPIYTCSGSIKTIFYSLIVLFCTLLCLCHLKIKFISSFIILTKSAFAQSTVKKQNMTSSISLLVRIWKTCQVQLFGIFLTNSYKHITKHSSTHFNCEACSKHINFVITTYLKYLFQLRENVSHVKTYWLPG